MLLAIALIALSATEAHPSADDLVPEGDFVSQLVAGTSTESESLADLYPEDKTLGHQHKSAEELYDQQVKEYNRMQVDYLVQVDTERAHQSRRERKAAKDAARKRGATSTFRHEMRREVHHGRRPSIRGTASRRNANGAKKAAKAAESSKSENQKKRATVLAKHPQQFTLPFKKEVVATGATVAKHLPPSTHPAETPPTCSHSKGDLNKLCDHTECANWVVCGRHGVHHGSDGKDCTYCPRHCFYCECQKKVQDDAHTTPQSQKDHMYSCDMTPYDTRRFCPLNCKDFDKCKGNANRPCKSYPRRCVQCECLKKGYPTDYAEDHKFHMLMRKKDDPLGIKGHKGESLVQHELDGISTSFWPYA
jgi:hypothetical protein